MIAYASRFREFASNAPLASSWDLYSTLAMNIVPGFVAGDEDKEQRWVPYMQSSVTSPIYIALILHEVRYEVRYYICNPLLLPRYILRSRPSAAAFSRQ